MDKLILTHEETYLIVLIFLSLKSLWRSLSKQFLCKEAEIFPFIWSL